MPCLWSERTNCTKIQFNKGQFPKASQALRNKRKTWIQLRSGTLKNYFAWRRSYYPSVDKDLPPVVTANNLGPSSSPVLQGLRDVLHRKYESPGLLGKDLGRKKTMQLVNETVVKPATRSFLKRETLLPSAGKGKTRRQGSELGMTIPCACQPTTGWFCQGEWRKAKMEQQAWVNVQWCTNKAFQPKTDRRC